MSPLAKFLSTLGRLYPLYSGCHKLANTKIFRWSLGNCSGFIWTRLRNERWILVPIEQWGGRSLYFFGDIDQKITWLCRQIIRQGDTVLDIGANIGLISIISRKIVGNMGQVHAFEPQPLLADIMRQSLEKNNYLDVKVHNIALGNKKEYKELFIPSKSFAEASLTRIHHPKGNNTSVLVENATEYLTHLELPPIRLVKIDVEGYESEVIEGASNFFENHRPDSILFELNDYNIPFCKQPVVIKLSELGYQFFDIPKSKFKMRVVPIESNASTWNGSDILAVPKGKIYNEIGKLVGAF